MSILALLSAFGGGILAFFSPCTLPLLPGYISLMSGISARRLMDAHHPHEVARHAGAASLFFVAGFSVAFAIMGASASFLGEFLVDHKRGMTIFAGILLLLFGGHMAGLIRIGIFNYEKRIPLGRFHAGFAGAFMMGMVFAAGWSPCIGPFLGGLLIMAATQGTMLKGVLLLFAFSLGLGIPFVITGFSTGRALAFLHRHKGIVRYSEVCGGWLMMVLGMAFLLSLYFQSMRSILPV